MNLLNAIKCQPLIIFHFKYHWVKLKATCLAPYRYLLFLFVEGSSDLYVGLFLKALGKVAKKVSLIVVL